MYIKQPLTMRLRARKRLILQRTRNIKTPKNNSLEHANAYKAKLATQGYTYKTLEVRNRELCLVIHSRTIYHD